MQHTAPKSNIWINSSARTWSLPSSPPSPAIQNFHRSLPSYAITPLIRCPSLASSLRVQDVFIKDESSRMGLPAFKILGASWACHLATTQLVGLAPTATLDEVVAACLGKELSFFAATDGNHGRAVARMARLFGIGARIFVPAYLDEVTRESIRGEGAEVVVSGGDYDEAVREAKVMSDGMRGRGIFVQDTAFEGYEEVPKWIVDGYSTMFLEADQQIQDIVGAQASVVVVPVGVGSLAMSVVEHYKSAHRLSTIIAVEPETANCLQQSLMKGVPQSIRTGTTIMSGMNCGTVSTIAWPLLKKGIDVSVCVSDVEAHEALGELSDLNVFAGPCGAAALAAVRKVQKMSNDALLGETSTVLLLLTEGARDYES